MSVKKTSKKDNKGYDVQLNPALAGTAEIALNEEWANFMNRVGHISTLVRDMASGDKTTADAAQKLADNYLEGKVIIEENVKMKVKDDRTVINQKAFKSMETKDTGEVDKDAWMTEVGKDADRRALDRKIRQEKADTLKTQAMKAFRRGEYEKALSCYNRAIEQVKDNAMMYCDRALTNIKLKNYDKALDDCYWAVRINENSYKARLYKTKAYKELEETEKFEECRQELKQTFPQHEELTTTYLEKKDQEYEIEEAAYQSDSD